MAKSKAFVDLQENISDLKNTIEHLEKDLEIKSASLVSLEESFKHSIEQLTSSKVKLDNETSVSAKYLH